MLMCARRTSKVAAGILGCSLAAAITAAQKLEVQTHRDQRADFSAIRTYGWLPTPPATSDVAPGALDNPNLSAKVLDPHIVAAIDRELAARGLKQVDQAESDVRVVYYAAMHVGVESDVLGSYYRYTTGWALPAVSPSTASMTIYQRGSVIVDVVNRTDTAIWRGSVATRVNHENTLDKRIARINEAIAKIFERFPLPRVKK